MAARIRRTLRRLAHPRSRRTELWACVFCGAFEDAEFEDADPEDASDTRRAG